MPTLPKIDGVLTQGGDGFGAAKALQEAGRPTPIIILGNRQEELAWWAEQKKTGYQTMSVDNPTKLGVDYAVFEFAAFAARRPDAAIKVILGA